MAKAKDTSFGTITADFIAEFLKQYASKEQQASFKASAYPLMYAVPVLDDNGLQKVIPAHRSKTGKEMKAKLATKWTIPADKATEQEYIKARYATRREYSHLHAKMWLIDEEEGMRKTLIEKGYEYLIPTEGKGKAEAKSARLFDFLD